jgi:hypothetical protein
MQFTGGNGGNSANNGFSGGTGGAAGQINMNGGAAAASSVSANGGNGGAGGTITLNGGTTFNSTSAGNGGSISAAGAAAGFNGATINFAPTSTRHGGNMTTFGSTYLDMTLFTTTTTAGPNNTSSETSLLGTAANLAPVAGQVSGKNIASNVVDHAGRTIRIQAQGWIATNGTPTLEIKFKIGTTAIIDTGAVALPVSVTSTQMWRFTAQATCRTTGASSTWIGQGMLNYFSGATTMQSIPALQTATSTIDLTQDEAIDLTAQFSTGTGCTMQCTDAVCELVN